MNLINSIFAEIFKAEQAIIPVYAHDPKTQAISAVVLVGESMLQGILGAIAGAHAAKTPAAPVAAVAV